jgi:hypothetical protein
LVHVIRGVKTAGCIAGELFCYKVRHKGLHLQIFVLFSSVVRENLYLKLTAGDCATSVIIFEVILTVHRR